MTSKWRLAYRIFKAFLKGKKNQEIKTIISEYQLKMDILEFRAQSHAFGYDLTEFTDEEILQTIDNGSKEIAKCGVTADEFSMVMNQLGVAVANYEKV